jgi:hypothetical protein
VLLILVLLTASTLALRLRGIDWLLPHFVEPDAHLAVQVEGFRAGREALVHWGGELDYSKYPHLLARILQPLPGFAAPDELGEAALEAHTGPHLRLAMGAVLETRYLIAILGAGLAPLTFLLARTFLTTPWSLFASALVIFSLLHQHYAQQARPHAATATLSLLAVLVCLWLRRRPTPALHAVAGFGAALALGSLHNGAAVLVPLAAALPLARGGKPLSRWIGGPLLAAIPIALSLRIFYPFFFAGEREAARLDVSSEGIHHSAHSLQWSQLDGSGFATTLRSLWSYEPTTLVLALIGAAYWGLRLRRGRANHDPEARRDLLVVLAYAVPYAIVIGLFALTYQRFVLPLLPYLACAAAAGAEGLNGIIGARVRPGVRNTASALLCVALLSVPAWATWRLGSLRAAPDTLERAAAWLADNTDPATTRSFVSPGIDVPIARRAEAVRADAELPHRLRPEPWSAYLTALLEARGGDLPLFVNGYLAPQVPVRGRREVELLTREPGAFFRELDVELLVVPMMERARHSLAWLLRNAALESGTRVARFSAEPDERLSIHPLTYWEEPPVDPMNFLLRVLRADAVGPTIEIYRLRERSDD